jgi:hypothetical protein
VKQILNDAALRASLRVAGPLRAADFTWDVAADVLWRAFANLHAREA